MQNVSEQGLREAIDRAGLAPEVFDRIQAELSTESGVASGFEAAHVAYYLGALLIIGAMGWFITDAWDRLSGITLTAVAVLYGMLSGCIGFVLSRKAATSIPGSILAAVAVCMTPMAVYGIERQLHWWPVNDPGGYSRFHPYIDANWVVMEIITILVAAAVLRFVRFPFITAPAAYALWYLSMDATALICGVHWTFKQECRISIAFGVVMMLVAYLLDKRSDPDFSFWFYLFGLLTFTGGLTFRRRQSTWQSHLLRTTSHSHGPCNHLATPRVPRLWRARGLRLSNAKVAGWTPARATINYKKYNGLRECSLTCRVRFPKLGYFWDSLHSLPVQAGAIPCSARQTMVRAW